MSSLYPKTALFQLGTRVTATVSLTSAGAYANQLLGVSSNGIYIVGARIRNEVANGEATLHGLAIENGGYVNNILSTYLRGTWATAAELAEAILREPVYVPRGSSIYHTAQHVGGTGNSGIYAEFFYEAL